MIRTLTAEELPSAAHLAAAAFREDPGFSHLIPDDAARRRRLPALIEALLRVDAAAGGRAAGAFDGGALVGMSAVMPAGSRAPRLRDWLGRWRGLSWMLKDPSAILRSLALVDAMERLRPASADYLHLLAVHPATQGRGVGAALVRDALKSENPLYLETFTPENVAWYEARGFLRLAEVASPVRPTFWTLRRGLERSILHSMILLLASLVAASLAAAETPPACAPVSGIGCVYVPVNAAADAPLFVYFRGWVKPYDGSVPASERLRTSRGAFTAYDLDRAADGARAILLVTGSSDAAVRDADVDALEKQLGRRFSRLILAAHSGGYAGLDASLPQKREVARVIMLDDFYFNDGPDSLGRRVAALVAKGAACAGFYTPHNKDRWEQRFKPYLTCPVDAFGKSDHDAKVKDCLRGYATTGTCR